METFCKGTVNQMPACDIFYTQGFLPSLLVTAGILLTLIKIRNTVDIFTG